MIESSGHITSRYICVYVIFTIETLYPLLVNVENYMCVEKYTCATYIDFKINKNKDRVKSFLEMVSRLRIFSKSFQFIRMGQGTS